jgi:hypothetical protein
MNDLAFGEIAQRCGSIEGLLDEFFGFLNRRTDFYVEFDPTVNDSGTKEVNNAKKFSMGFPKDTAEAIVLKSFHKYPMKRYEDMIKSNNPSGSTTASKMSCASVTTSQSPHAPSSSSSSVSSSSSSSSSLSGSKSAGTIPSPVQPRITEDGQQIPIGNGGIGENYYWTQTLKEVTVYFDIPESTKSKDVSCEIKSSSLSLKVLNQVYLEGLFEFPVKPSDCLWTLMKGNDVPQLIITLEKAKEIWWKSVVVGHPEIDTSKVISCLSFLPSYSSLG